MAGHGAAHLVSQPRPAAAGGRLLGPPAHRGGGGAAGRGRHLHQPAARPRGPRECRDWQQ